jgi:alpha-tubulin suppressor-like RCC1 family protein
VIASHVPLAVAGDRRWIQLTAANTHACGIAFNGSAYCWGDNDRGQLGDGTNISSSTPVAVAGNITWSMISAGTEHSCGISTNGSAFCWGYNAAGAVGDGSFYYRRFRPRPVAGNNTWVGITAGFYFSCGITTQASMLCWGFGESGGLGNGLSTATNAISTPTAVADNDTSNSTWGLRSYSDPANDIERTDSSTNLSATSVGGVVAGTLGAAALAGESGCTSRD